MTKKLDERAPLDSLNRKLKTSATGLKLGAHLLGLRIGIGKKTSSAHAQQLTHALGGLKGPAMKAAQIMSMVPGLLPENYAQELQVLQASAPPMGWAFVKRRMTKELGPDWSSLFASFDQTPYGAASLGQVHRATLPDGQLVVCKLQYPKMDTCVEADLAQLQTVLSLYKGFDGTIDPSELIAELKERLHEELDYVKEAQSMEKFANSLKPISSDVVVPSPFPSLSTDRLLTMTYVAGTPFADQFTQPQEHKNIMAEQLFKAFYYPFYKDGYLHGDPHFGNYLCTPDQKIALLDFGCVRYFNRGFSEAVYALYQGLLHNNPRQIAEAFDAWGFIGLSAQTIEILTVWARFLYDPLLDNRVRPVRTDNGEGLYGADIAQKVYKDLKKEKALVMPRSFVLMDRAALGLGSAFMRLSAEHNWHHLFESVVDRATSDRE
jgi:predicted unusual protein kinase regulating ubiquinone biosynthesis (AarF/ABC1/UbiB family)